MDEDGGTGHVDEEVRAVLERVYLMEEFFGSFGSGHFVSFREGDGGG